MNSEIKKMLTKKVEPDWYKRYAKVLSYEERLYIQPLRELREEKAMLESLEPQEEGIDKLAIERSEKLARARGQKVQLVLQILDGNVKDVDVKSLRVNDDTPILLEAPKVEKKQTLFLRNRAIRPDGYILSPDSKWRLFWESPKFIQGIKDISKHERLMKIKGKWMKAFRTIQGVNNFAAVLADLSGASEDTVKKIATNGFKARVDGSLFNKSHFKATNVGRMLDVQVIFTLSKGLDLRTDEETAKAALVLRVIRSFSEFPVFLQRKLCAVGWYLDVEDDTYIIREGHMAECIYFILSGKVAALQMNPKTGSLTTAKTYSCGSLLGEDAIIKGGYRETTMRTIEHCRLIMVDIDDLQVACSKGDQDGLPPEHLIYLSQLTYMKFFPISMLVESNTGDIKIFFFRNGTVITDDIYKSKNIIFVKKGTCRVLAEVEKKRKHSVLDVVLPPIASTRSNNVLWEMLHFTDDILTTPRNTVTDGKGTHLHATNINDTGQNDTRVEGSQNRPNHIRNTIQRTTLIGGSAGKEGSQRMIIRKHSSELRHTRKEGSQPRPDHIGDTLQSISRIGGSTRKKGSELLTTARSEGPERQSTRKEGSQRMAANRKQSSEQRSTRIEDSESQAARKENAQLKITATVNAKDAGRLSTHIARPTRTSTFCEPNVLHLEKRSKTYNRDSARKSTIRKDPLDSKSRSAFRFGSERASRVTLTAGNKYSGSYLVPGHGPPAQNVGFRKSQSGKSELDIHKTMSYRVRTTNLLKGAAHELLVLSEGTIAELEQLTKTSRWIHLKTLVEGDQVGIETINLGDGVNENPLRIAVVSEGATVIFMNKKFFNKGATAQVRMDLRANGLIFPGQDMLKAELQRKTNWKNFEENVLKDRFKKEITNDPLPRSWEYPGGIYTFGVM